ncbi:DUF3592 domain-containing protein [Methylomonas sp. SURF-2]|uniref:DUF3592 domain-containing protein n=1 Tax=Methylomonas subterranea TaxID=2952225 RepID=A0ABT1TCE7_9GAMM|nr:DUF3592 domain-containing protein [Methylomonas sp. SURF-2]MCQ8102969.1 DUF3592 domain-containing protein [Methylomonas sp. SURF-2]
MMIECRSLKPIQRIKTVLSIALAALALLNLYLAVTGTLLNVEKLTVWSRQPAQIFSLADETTVEIEVTIEFAEALPAKTSPEDCYAHQPGNTCLLLPANPYAWLSVFDEVELLQNPAQPAQLDILSLSGLWLPVCGHFLFVLLLGATWRWLAYRSGWGEDRTWFNGAWVATHSAPQRIGFSDTDAKPVTESGGSRKGVTFWCVLFVLIALPTVPAAIAQMATDPLLATLILAGGLGILLLALFTAVGTFSRVIQQDRTGLVDSSFFGIKRVAWSSVAAVDLVNLNREAQQRYDRSHSLKESRPQTLNVYKVTDKQGREILSLSETMAPPRAFHALLARLRGRAERESREMDDLPLRDVSQDDFEAEWIRMTGSSSEPRKSLFHPSHRGTLFGLILMLAPFVLITALLCYKSLWFICVAERAQGRVVEVKRDGLPSLVVEYRPAAGGALQIESDGTEAYGDFKVGDTITVYYDAADPEDARLDLFLELWLGAILMGSLTALVLLTAVLIGRSLTAPMLRL